MIQTETTDTASTAAELPPGQGKPLVQAGAEVNKIPNLLSALSDSELAQTVALGSALQQFRDRATRHPILDDMKRVAPGFQGQILDFHLEDKHVKTFQRDVPDPPVDIIMPTVKPLDIVYARDMKEAKALDSTLCEVSNRLLAATGYLMDVLQNLSDVSDKKLAEFIFRSMCLTASATSMVEVERLLRPGDRDRIRFQVGSTEMPSVIQEVRRTTLTTTMAPAAAPLPLMGTPASPVFALPPPLPFLQAPIPSGLVARSDVDALSRQWRRPPPDDDWEETYRPKRGRGRSPRQHQMSYTFRRGSPFSRSPPTYPTGGKRRYLAEDGSIRAVMPGEAQGPGP